MTNILDIVGTSFSSTLFWKVDLFLCSGEVGEVSTHWSSD